MLLDNDVKPIALYSCEIWGKKVKLKENIEKIWPQITYKGMSKYFSSA